MKTGNLKVNTYPLVEVKGCMSCPFHGYENDQEYCNLQGEDSFDDEIDAFANNNENYLPVNCPLLKNAQIIVKLKPLKQ